MSARNGDKARFGKQRKRKMAHRARTQELREGLKAGAVPGVNGIAPSSASGSAPGAEAAAAEHHGALDSAAGAVGSVLGTIAAKVKHVVSPEPAHAE